MQALEAGRVPVPDSVVVGEERVLLPVLGAGSVTGVAPVSGFP